jgi:CheY-like chemotaxis protein
VPAGRQHDRVDRRDPKGPWDDGRPLVLIIDEEETVRDLYGDWFSEAGFQVMCAVGESGLRLALHRERPQLIVTELTARDLTLRGLLTRLQSDDTTRCIPVIVLTNTWDGSVWAHAKALGAAAVLPKLTDFDVLKSWVEALC